MRWIAKFVGIPQDQTVIGKDHVSHQAWFIFYQYGHATAFNTWVPTAKEMDWLCEKYPDTFDRLYRPRFELLAEKAAKGERFYNNTLPQLCQVCQIPLAITEPDDDTLISHRDTVHDGERYHFCSDGCRDIFHHEPEKYVQAWLPVHQILQGNCGGADMEKVIGDYYRIEMGEDNLDFEGSAEQRRWAAWKQAV